MEFWRGTNQFSKIWFRCKGRIFKCYVLSNDTSIFDASIQIIQRVLLCSKWRGTSGTEILFLSPIKAIKLVFWWSRNTCNLASLVMGNFFILKTNVSESSTLYSWKYKLKLPNGQWWDFRAYWSPNIFVRLVHTWVIVDVSNTATAITVSWNW